MKVVRGYGNAAGGFSPPIHGYGAFGGAGDAGSLATAADVSPEYEGNPLILTGSAVVQPKMSAGVNNEALRNPFDFPIEIHELRFTAVGLLVLTGAGYLYQNPMPSLGVSLALEGDPAVVTKNFVPIYTICPGQQLAMESIGCYGAAGAGHTYYVGTYRLGLKTPLVLKPREVLTAAIQNIGLVTGGTQIGGVQPGTATVYVSYVCRTREDLKLGRTRVVPYFAAYTPSGLVQPAAGAPVSATSSELDLANQTQKPIRIARFIGRCALTTSTTILMTSTTQNSALSEFTDANVTSDATARPGPDAIQCGMFRSNGLPIIPQSTPFRLAFDSFTRAWEVDDADLIVEPNDYFKATVQIAPPDAGITQQLAQLFMAIGMTGYREEAL
jgi:hypothetical protein